MMQIEKIRPWDQSCEAGLAVAVGEDRDLIARGVNAGWLEAYRLYEGAAYMVTRFENGTLTVCCYEGRHARETCAWLATVCRQRGIKRLNFHTSNPALARLLKPWDFRLKEYVFEADMSGSAH